MNVFLWIVQGVLAAAFATSGVMKSTQPRDQLIPKLPWVNDVSTPVLRLIGVTQSAAALGLILPAAFDIAPVLTPLAATGLGVIMVLAMALHARRKEPGAIAFNAVLLILAAVVMWGRFGPYAF